MVKIFSSTRFRIAAGITMAVAIILVIATLTWMSIKTGTLLSDNHKDPFEGGIKEALKSNLADYNLWYRLNVTLNFVSTFAAVLASAVAAFTTRDNAEYMKYPTIILTLIVSIITSGFSTLRVPEAVEMFITINSDLSKLQAAYISEREPFYDKFLAKNKNLKDSEHEMTKEMLEIYKKYSEQYDKILESRMRVWLKSGYQAPPIGQKIFSESERPTGDTSTSVTDK